MLLDIDSQSIPYTILHFISNFFSRYGHIETVHHVAEHLAQIREMQVYSKNEFNIGFTEFVPLSFVAKESPMWKLQNENETKNKINRSTVKTKETREETNFIEKNQDDSMSSLDHILHDINNDIGTENKMASDRPWIRSGPTGVEVVLTHAVSRIMLSGHINNIQVCKLGIWREKGEERGRKREREGKNRESEFQRERKEERNG